MAKADVVYAELLKDILENGVIKNGRNGSTVSVFGREIRFNMADGFPLLTTKKMFSRGIIEELLWFLDGNTSVKELIYREVDIWTGDAYKKYLRITEERANRLAEDGDKVNYRPLSKEDFKEKILTNSSFEREWADLGPVYGKQWVNWGGHEIISGEEVEGLNKGINQIQNAIDLLKSDPNSRRNMVNAWNVSDIDKMTLPPCHYGFQLYTEELTYNERFELYMNDETYYKPHFDEETVDNIEGINMTDEPERFFTNLMNEDGINFPTHKLSLKWDQRSVDTFLGLPFNIASYAFLLHMFAQQANMVPHELIGNLGDTHLYSNHLVQVDEQLSRATDMSAPILNLNKAEDMFSYKVEDFKIEDYFSYSPINAELSN